MIRLLVLLGYCFVIKSIIIVGMALLIWILIYPRTIKHEEKKLLKIHKDEYLNYYNRTPKIIPNKVASDPIKNPTIKKIFAID